MTSVTVTSTPFQVSVDDAGTSVTVSATGPAGQGVPAGGSDGQVLKKSGGTNYVTEWASGGTGDMLASNNLSELANDATARSNLGVPATNHNHSAGNITSGTLATDRIPDLAASKITSGTIAAARIPTLGTGSISGLGDSAVKDVGTASDEVAAGNDSRFTDARTPVAHSADLVTSGTLAVARGGTGVTSVPMVGVISAANVGAARTVLGLGTAAVAATGTGDANVILGNDARLADDRDPTNHSTAKLTSGTLAVARGGTGVTSLPMISVVTAADATASRSALGLGTAAVAATGTGSSNVILGNDARLADDRDPNAHSAALITSGTLAAARGGTGVASIPMVGVISAANAGAARTVLELGTAALVATGTGDANAILGNDARLTDDRDPTNHSTAKLTSGTLAVARGGTGVTSLAMVSIPAAADAAAARTVLGVTNVGSYTGQIETVADKTYTIDPGAATDRTISGFFIKSASGTVTAALKVGTAVVKSASVTDSTGDQTSLANTSVSANDVLTLVTSSNSSALDVIFAVEFTE